MKRSSLFDFWGEAMVLGLIEGDRDLGLKGAIAVLSFGRSDRDVEVEGAIAV